MRYVLIVAAFLVLPVFSRAAGPVTLAVAESRLLHDRASWGTDLPVEGAVFGLETRAGNKRFTLVLTFDQDLAEGLAYVSQGTGSVVSATVSPKNPKQLFVRLAGVEDAQALTVLASVTARTGGSGYGSLTVGFLQGDVNGDGTVDQADLAKARSKAGEEICEFNMMADVNCDGQIDDRDFSLISNQFSKKVLH